MANTEREVAGQGDSEREIKDRLRKIEGQVRGIQRMVEEHRPCEEIITQMLAARTALDKVGVAILSGYVAECLAGLPPEKARAAIDRAVQLFGRL